LGRIEYTPIVRSKRGKLPANRTEVYLIIFIWFEW